MDFACSSWDHFWSYGILRPQSAGEKITVVPLYGLSVLSKPFLWHVFVGNSIISLLDVEDMTEKVFFILFIAVLIACGFGIRIISARTNREEYEMQINADKDET